MNRPAVITVEHLRAEYDGNVILEDVSFKVHEGEVFVVLGGSGCGKSTLLKHLIGLYRPARGRITILDQSLISVVGDPDESGSNPGTDFEPTFEPKGAARREILRRFGVTYQSGALFGSMTLLQNVRLPLEEFTAFEPEARDLIALNKLRLVGLDTFAHYFPSQISGGMQKRASIARALALDPRILFLDEPSAGLDPLTSADLDQLILELSKNLGITFVIVTHELASVFTIADRVIVLDKSKRGILDQGNPKELRDQSQHEAVRAFLSAGANRSKSEKSEGAA